MQQDEHLQPIKKFDSLCEYIWGPFQRTTDRNEDGANRSFFIHYNI